MKRSIISIIALLGVMMPSITMAQSPEPYAVLSESNTKLTFYYNDNKDAIGGMDIGPFGSMSDRGWDGVSNIITTVVFDDSFASYSSLTSTAHWFDGCSNMTTVLGISNLNTSNVTTMYCMFRSCNKLESIDLEGFDTSNVTDMRWMFYSCKALTSLDVTGFNTANVTDMSYMFEGCSELTTLDLSSFNTEKVGFFVEMFLDCSKLNTIFVGDGWTTAAITDATVSGNTGDKRLFTGCTQLKGGAGTAFDSGHVDADYAHIDGGTTNPGYFTDIADKDKVNEPYAVLSNDPSSPGKILTFYYNKHKTANNGLSVGPFNYTNRSWEGDSELIQSVIFDDSFANCTTLTSTAFWFMGCSNLTSIEGIENLKTDNVTDVSDMFYGCSSLTSLDVSGFKTDNVTTISGMFYGCSSLTSLDVSGFKTDNVTDMNGMFEGCSSLTSLDVSGFKTDNVTTMSGMFYGCSSLTSLDVSGFKTDNVTNMSVMFEDCSSLTGLDVSGFKTDNVTSMNRMFYYCSKLTTLDVSNFNTKNVTDMFRMFEGCSRLTDLDVSNFETDNVSNMWGMFGGCSSLTSLDLSNFKTDNVTSMGSMFWACSILTDLNVSSFKTDNVTDMKRMFDQCSKLATLDISSFNTENVTDMVEMFRSCYNLTTIYVGNDWSTTNVTSGDDMFIYCNSLVGYEGTTLDANHVDHTYAHIDGGSSNPGYLTDVQYKDAVDEPYAVLTDNSDVVTTDNGTVTGKTLTFYYDKEKTTRSGMDVGPFQSIDDGNPETVNSGWNSSRETITKVVFDESFANCTSITSTAYWFFCLKALTEIKGLTNLKTDNVTDMWGMFYNCTSLKSLDLSAFNTSNVTCMTGVFHNCSSLTSLDVSSFNTENVTVFEEMFWGCSKLESLDLSNFNTEKCTNFSGMFKECLVLNSLNISNFNTANTTDMTSMFGNCESLTSIDVSSFNTEKVTKIGYMFGECTSLTSLDLSSFNTANVTDMEYMFRESPNLKTIYVSDKWNTTSATGSEVFRNCTSLVGGEGTTYNASEISSAYARIDDPDNNNPGYFTNAIYKGVENEPYTVLTDNDDEIATDDGTVNGKTLTFYYDKKKTTRDGIDIDYRKWMDDAKKISKVIFDASFENCSSITSTANWFALCSNLTTFTNLEYLNTENVTDMSDMFNGCRSLTSIDVGNFNTSNVTNMNCMFSNCHGLTSLDVNNFKTDNVTDMGAMFFGCSGLTTLDVSSFKTDNVTNMTSMFNGCSSLTSLDLSSFKTDNVTSMSSMYRECSSLTSLDLSNFKTDNVTNMSYMFCDCYDLTSLDLSNFKTDNVTNMSNMFFKCKSLSGLDVSNFKTNNVTSMNSLFTECQSLTSLDVSNFKTDNVTNMESMFDYCYKLTSLDVSNFKTDNVTNMSGMFKGCSGLTTIYVGEGWNTDNVTSSSYMFSNNTNLIGGAGTTYDAEHTDVTYAHIDGGASNPGYFTDINAPASFDIKVRTVGNGKVTIDRVVVDSDNEGIVVAERGSAVTMVFTPDEGYKLESVVVDTVNVTMDLDTYNEVGAKTYTLDKIYDFHTVIATFANNTVTLTAKSYTRKYGEQNPTFEYTAEGASFSGKPTITCEATDTTSVGTYPIVITYTEAADTRAATAIDETSSPNVVCVNGTLTITKTPLKVAAKSYTIKRGSPIPTFEIEYSGFVNNETDTVLTKKAAATCEAKNDTVPGTYQIVVSGAEAKNYEIEYVNGSLTITDDVVVTAKSYTREYGEANPTFEYTADGAILEGTPAITCEATATSPVGTYDITIAKGDITNSDVTYVKGTLTITKAPLTITAESYSIKQGKALPTFALKYSGFKNNETDTVFTTKPTVTTRATSYSNPGTYDIIVSGAEAANYEIKYVNGTLTITEKTESFDGFVLRVNEGGNIDDAFENMGGREEAAKTIAAIIWNASDPLTDEMLEGIDNPNLLVYVSDKKHAPKSVKNMVVDGVASYISLTDDSTKNCNFYVPEEFVADSIVYTREFKQTTKKNVSRGWEGIVLPFTVQTFSHKTHGEIAPFGNTASKYHFWLHAITEDGVVDATTIEANKPYIISMPNSEEYTAEFNQAGLVTFASADVKVPATETMDVWLGDSVVIIPTLQRVEKYDMVYALNVLYDFDDYKEGSVFVSNYRDIRPFEIYTFHEHHHHEGAGARFISVSSLFGGEGTTGIIDVMKNAEPNGETWYDLNGRRLQSKPVRKGVYIKNGKKVVVK